MNIGWKLWTLPGDSIYEGSRNAGKLWAEKTAMNYKLLKYFIHGTFIQWQRFRKNKSSMQCADIFHLKADICQLGMDQRKVNMLAREYCDAKKIRYKPIILSHRTMIQFIVQERNT